MEGVCDWRYKRAPRKRRCHRFFLFIFERDRNASTELYAHTWSATVVLNHWTSLGHMKRLDKLLLEPSWQLISTLNTVFAWIGRRSFCRTVGAAIPIRNKRDLHPISSFPVEFLRCLMREQFEIIILGIWMKWGHHWNSGWSHLSSDGCIIHGFGVDRMLIDKENLH